MTYMFIHCCTYIQHHVCMYVSGTRVPVVVFSWWRTTYVRCVDRCSYCQQPVLLFGCEQYFRVQVCFLLRLCLQIQINNHCFFFFSKAVSVCQCRSIFCSLCFISLWPTSAVGCVITISLSISFGPILCLCCASTLILKRSPVLSNQLFCFFVSLLVLRVRPQPLSLHLTYF